MAHIVSTAAVRAALIEGREMALLDVREEGPYSRGHPLFAVSLPLSRIELKVLDLVPRSDAPIVLYDDGGGLVERAEARLCALGYTDVARLDGGLDGWRRAGGGGVIDVNGPSKAFGELVESKRHTPSLSAREVCRVIAEKADVVVLDSRRFEEYRNMSIPTGTSVPGGELVLRLQDMAPRPETTVIVNCAGRTRSIIGTQSLINAGIPNPVFALRNGTIGWTLAGLDLDRGAGRRFPGLSAGGRRAPPDPGACRTCGGSLRRSRYGRAMATATERVHAVPARRAQSRGIRSRSSAGLPLGTGRAIGAGDRRMGRRAPRPPRPGRRRWSPRHPRRLLADSDGMAKRPCSGW